MGGVRPSDRGGRDGPRKEEWGERSPGQGVEDGWDRGREHREAGRLKGETQPSSHHCSI